MTLVLRTVRKCRLSIVVKPSRANIGWCEAENNIRRRPAKTTEGPRALIPGPLHCLKRSAEAGTADQRAIPDEAAKQTQVTATGARLVKQ
jgi:hypothetical protein